MRGNITLDQIRNLQGHDVFDNQGDKLGSIEHIYYDTQTQEPEWVGLSIGLFGMKHVVVPLDGASREGDGLKVRYAKDLVKDSPSINENEISQEQESELYRHYGLQYSHGPSDTGLPEGGQQQMRQGAGRNRDIEGRQDMQDEARMTRSEEELRVGKREMDAGQVRLRKYVETEPVSADVDLTRERATVERHPVDRPVEGAEIGEEEATVNLTREEPVVQKETVAKEEVTLGKEREHEEQRIDEEVRKERIVEEGDEGLRRAS